MRAALASFVGGIGSVVRAPAIVAAVWLVTFVAALPFAMFLGADLQAALAHQPAIDLAAEEIDADWWTQFRDQTDGLAATFTPVILGALAPLATFSSLLDGNLPLAPAVAIVFYAALWSFLLGGILHRYQHQAASLREMSTAAVHYFPQFAALTALGAALVLVLYATIHRVLFGPVYAALILGVEAESSVFAVRAAVYLVFGGILAAIALTIDYSRIALVSGHSTSIGHAIASAVRFMRHHAGAVFLLALVTALVFGMLLSGYVVADQQFRGWRSVLLGQVFVGVRLVMRLISASSQIDLVRRLENL